MYRPGLTTESSVPAKIQIRSLRMLLVLSMLPKLADEVVVDIREETEIEAGVTMHVVVAVATLPPEHVYGTVRKIYNFSLCGVERRWKTTGIINVIINSNEVALTRS